MSPQMKDHDPSDPPLARMPSEAADAEAPGQARVADHYANASQDALAREKEGIDNEDTRNSHTPLPPDSPTPVKDKEKGKQSAAKGPQPFDQAEKEEMESLLRELRGHLGESSLTYPKSGCTDLLLYSFVPYSIPRGRGRREQLLVPFGQVSRHELVHIGAKRLMFFFRLLPLPIYD